MATGEELIQQGTAQGEKVRQLKASGASKDEVMAEVKILMDIKAQYKEVTGEDYPAPNKGSSKKKKKGGAQEAPKPAAAPAASAPASSDPKVAALVEKVGTVGNAIREMKSAKAAKDEIDAKVKELLSLKEEYKTLTGEPFPAPGKGPSKKDKKKKESPAPSSAKAEPAKKEKAVAPKPAHATPAPKATASTKIASVAPSGSMLAKTMYHIESYHKDAPDTGACKTMYKQEPISFIEDGSDLPPAIAELEKRQIRILENLEALITKAENEIKRRTGGVLPPLAPISGGASGSGKKSSASLEVSVTAPVNKAPLATLVVCEMLANRGKTVDVRQYWHSSLCLVDKVPTAECLQAERNRPMITCDLRLRLTWKDVEEPSLVVSSAMQTPICGDSNIARYLCRSMAPDLYPDSNPDVSIQIDQVLDTCLVLSSGSGNSIKMATKELKDINVLFGKSEYVCASGISLADIVLFATLTNNEDIKRPNNIKKFIEKFKGTPPVEAAVSASTKLIA